MSELSERQICLGCKKKINLLIDGFRCLDCPFFFCRPCAEYHFGKTDVSPVTGLRDKAAKNDTKITVNGRLVGFEPVTITYEEIVSLAGSTGNPSVTYCSKRDGDVRREGTMYTGCSPVLVTDAMTFNVMHTGGA